MGRLFWKFFFAFIASLLLASAGVAAAIWFQQSAREAQADGLAHGPRTALRIAAASAVSAHGGEAALRALLQDEAIGRGPPLLAVDRNGRDLLGRDVPVNALNLARSVAQSVPASASPGDGSPARGDDAPALSRTPARYVSTGDGREWLLFAPSVESPMGAERRPPPRRVAPSLLLAIGIASSLVVAALLAWYFARPARALSWALAAAEKGDLAVRVAPKIGGRRDEIADLGGQFDRMIRQIESLVEAQRRLFHDVSHELRSPLARLDVAVGLARRDPARIEQSLERIERESARLDALIGQLLTLARLESGADQGPSQRVDLVALLGGVVDDAAFEGQQRSVRIDYRHGEAIEAEVFADTLQSALDNVLRNAIRYAPDHSTVDVTLDARTDRRQATITIADRGPGLPEDELASVFRPFVRGSNRGRAQGFGLGLAIAGRAVEAHAGTIAARRRDGGGLVVEIVLPLERAGATSGSRGRAL